MHNKSLILALIVLSAATCLLCGFHDAVGANLTWESVPLRYEQQKAAGMMGGEGLQYVFGLTYAPSDPSIAYFCVDTAGVWKSTDGGATWRPQYRGYLPYGARSIGVDPINANVVFAAGFLGQTFEEAQKYPQRQEGIYRSADGAESWQIVRKMGFYRQTSALGRLFAFDTRDVKNGKTMTVYAGGFGEGLLRSSDGGNTWKTVALGGKEITDMQEDPVNPGTILVAATDGFYRYSMGTINKLGAGLPETVKTFAVSPQKPEVVYAAVGNYGIYKSLDFGATFRQSNSGLPRKYYSNVMVSPVDSDVVYARAHLASDPPYYSGDGGKSWHAPKETDMTHVLDSEGFWFSSPFAPHPKEPKTALHVSNGMARILKTTDGGVNWYYSGNGFTGGRMEAMVFQPNGYMLFCLTDHGLWETRNDADTFNQLNIARAFGEKSSSSADIRGQTLVASVGSFDKKIIAVSKNFGVTWKYFNQYVDTFNFIRFHPYKDNVIYAGPYRSATGGSSWKKLQYTIMAMNGGDGDIVYSAVGRSDYMSNVFKSTDGGTSWSLPYPPAPISGTSIINIAADPRNPDRVYLATANGVYIFNGSRWLKRNADHGLELDAYGRCSTWGLAIDPRNPDTLYVGRRAVGYGNSNGVFRSRDQGMTWENINYNLSPGLTVFSVHVSPYDSAVYISSSLGTYRMKTEP